MAVKDAVYQVDNGNGFDEIHFKTKAAQVFMESGIDLESGFLASKSPNGYMKLPNGMIIQWGIHGSPTTSKSIAFPIAFSTTQYALVVTPFSDIFARFRVSHTIATQFAFYAEQAVGFYWIAIGW